MSRVRRTGGPGGRPAGPPAGPILAVALLVAVAPARGQDPDPAPGDTVPVRDTAAADTIRPDTAAADGARPDTLPGGRGGRGADVEQMQANLTGGGFPERDSVFRRLVEESGYRAVEYRGKDVSLDVPERRIRLRDSAQANYSDAALRADSITYRARLQFISARGDIRLVSPDQRRMTTDSVLYYDISRLKGTVLSARTTFSARGAEWQVQGDAVPVGGRTLYVNRGTFTSCDRSTPHYFFRAGKIKMVSRDVIAAWPVTLYIADVPVFWLPFFAQDIRPERRSGIIPPQFGINDIVQTSDGTERQIQGAGYYWAIDRFMDASVTVDWFSGQFTRVNGRFRYNFRKDFIEGNVLVRRDFADASNLMIDASHTQRLTPDTRLRADIRFVTEEQLLRERSFETDEQTQTINSDVGLDHDFGFGNVTLSARRQQFLGTQGRVDLTVPDVRLSLSPVTLFEAPRNRAGPFNNLTLSPGGLSFTRRDQTRDRGDDVLTTTASVGPSLRLGDLSLSTSASFNRRETTPARAVVDPAGADTTFVDLASRLQSTLSWSTSADYQVDLMGSTSLRPDVEVSGGWFRSRTPPDTIRGDTVPDTGGRFVQTPTRFNVGANLSTDVFGFLPAFGPFSSIRHKISPRFRWQFSPGVTPPDSSLAAIPGFPGGRGETRNTLSVTLNQTFEAKMPVGGEEDGGDGGAGTGEGQADGGDDAAGDGEGEGGAGADRREKRTVTLLSIRSDALRFEFDRPGPALVTDRFSNSIGSDLFRGLDLTLAFDLYEGSGEQRVFSPILSRLNASVSLRSGQDLGDLVGLGPGGGGAGPTGLPDGGGAPGAAGRQRDEGEHEAGPWTLSLDYTLGRTREGASSAFGGRSGQTLSGALRLQPTPNWEMDWTTSYNIDENEFSSHQVTLTRNLHRWRAEFAFRKAPNGNFSFRFFVTLVDVPDLQWGYDQRSETR